MKFSGINALKTLAISTSGLPEAMMRGQQIALEKRKTAVQEKAFTLDEKRFLDDSNYRNEVFKQNKKEFMLQYGLEGNKFDEMKRQFESLERDKESERGLTQQEIDNRTTQISNEFNLGQKQLKLEKGKLSADKIKDYNQGVFNYAAILMDSFKTTYIPGQTQVDPVTLASNILEKATKLYDKDYSRLTGKPPIEGQQKETISADQIFNQNIYNSYKNMGYSDKDIARRIYEDNEIDEKSKVWMFKELDVFSGKRKREYEWSQTSGPGYPASLLITRLFNSYEKQDESGRRIPKLSLSKEGFERWSEEK